MALWTDLPFLAIDTETSGLSPERDRVIEVAWVRFEEGRIAEERAQLLRFEGTLSPDITALTSITAEALRQQPAFAEVAPTLLADIDDVAFVTAYNAPFDERFLRQECARAGLRFPSTPWIDALTLARDPALHPQEGQMRLADVAARYHVPLRGAHRALPDAVATGELLLRFAPSLPQTDLDGLLRHQLDLRIARRKAQHAERFGERC